MCKRARGKHEAKAKNLLVDLTASHTRLDKHVAKLFLTRVGKHEAKSHNLLADLMAYHMRLDKHEAEPFLTKTAGQTRKQIA